MKNKELWTPTTVEKDGNSYRINKKFFSMKSQYIGSLLIKEYIPVIKEHSKGVLLDCGCGSVPYYEIYKDLVDDVVCVDWEVCDGSVDHLDYKADLNKPLEFLQTESVDTIMLSDVLEHIYNPKELFAELSRILKKKGRLIVFVPFYYWIHSGPHDYFRYTEFALRRFCVENQLDILVLKPHSGYFDVLFDLINKLFINSYWGAKALVKISEQIKKTKFYKKRLPSRIGCFPLGYVLVAEK